MKLTRKIAALIVVTAISMPVTAYLEAAEPNIRETINGLERALNTRNLAALKTLYTSNATINLSVLKDLERRGHYRIDVIDLTVEKNNAYISALWSATAVTYGGNVKIVDGYMSNVLERQQNGEWKIKEQSWQ